MIQVLGFQPLTHFLGRSEARCFSTCVCLSSQMRSGVELKHLQRSSHLQVMRHNPFCPFFCSPKILFSLFTHSAGYCVCFSLSVALGLCSPESSISVSNFAPWSLSQTGRFLIPAVFVSSSALEYFTVFSSSTFFNFLFLFSDTTLFPMDVEAYHQSTGPKRLISKIDSNPGMGKLRPGGQMQPLWPFNPGQTKLVQIMSIIYISVILLLIKTFAYTCSNLCLFSPLQNILRFPRLPGPEDLQLHCQRWTE